MNGSARKPLNIGLTASGIDTPPLPSQWLTTSEGTGTSTTLYDGWPTHSPPLVPLEPKISGERLFNAPNYRDVFDREKYAEPVRTTSRLSGLLPSWPISSSGGKPVSSSGNAVKWEVCSIDFSSSRPGTHNESPKSSVPTDIANATKHPVFRQLMGQSSSQYSEDSGSSRGSYQSRLENHYERSHRLSFRSTETIRSSFGSAQSNSHNRARSRLSSSPNGGSLGDSLGSGFIANIVGSIGDQCSNDSTDSDSDRTVSDVDDSAYLPSDQLSGPITDPTQAPFKATLSITSMIDSAAVAPVVRPFVAPAVQPVVEPVIKAPVDNQTPATTQSPGTNSSLPKNFVPASPESPSAKVLSLANTETSNTKMFRKRTRSRALIKRSTTDDTDSDYERSDGEDQSYGAPKRKTSKSDAISLHRWRDTCQKPVLRVPTCWAVETNPSRPLSIPNMPHTGPCPRLVLSTRHQLQCMIKREASRRQSEILENPDNGHLPDNLGIEPRLNRLQTRDLGRKYLRPLLRSKNAVYKAVMAQKEWPRIMRGSIKCSPHCDLTFTTWGGLARHLDTTLDFTHRPYLCQEPDCLWSTIGFPTLSECWRHTRAAHTVVKFDCELCELEGENRTFTRSDALRRHYGRVHLQEQNDSEED